MVSPYLGCVVAVKTWWGEHWGIVGIRDGHWTLISNRGIRRGVTEERLEDVVGPAEWRIVEDLGVSVPANVIVARARSLIGSRYDFWKWNCQDFVYWACGLQPQSPQRAAVVGVLGLASVSLLLAVAAKRG
jgi:hypothetical protein